MSARLLNIGRTCHLLQTQFFNDTHLVLARTMAGHSKWQNIRHTKGAKDAQKSAFNNKLMSAIRIAAREGGSNDPKLNRSLERAIANARKNNLPANNIENFLKKTGEKQTAGTQSYIECRGPFGTFLIIDMFAEKFKPSRDKIQSILKKYGGSCGDPGTAVHGFDQKGVIYATERDGKKLTFDEKEEVAIEIGAEDVKEQEDDGTVFTVFYTDPKELHLVKKEIPDTFVVDSLRLEYIPNNYIELTEQQGSNMSDMLELLEDLEFVTRIYENVQVK